MDRPKLSREIEVINAGIPGYTTYQEMEFLKVYGLDMQPDAVVLGVVFNDLFQYLHQPTKKNFMASDSRRYLHRFDVDRFPGCWFSRSYLAHATALAWQGTTMKLTRSQIFTFDFRSDFYTAWKDYAWRKEADLIRQMQELLKQHNIQFSIVSFPIVEQVDDRNLSLNREHVLYPQRQLARICTSRGIPYRDLTEAIHTHGGTNLFVDYLHLNKRGNDLMATELTDFLAQSVNQ